MKPKWTIARWRELYDLRMLLWDVSQLNHTTNIVAAIQRVSEGAKKALSRTRKRQRPSLIDFLESLANEDLPTKEKAS